MKVSLEWFMANMEDLKYISESYDELRDAYEVAHGMFQAEVLRLEKLEAGVRNG